MLLVAGTIAGQPTPSANSLTGANTATPSFTPNAAGTYVATLSGTDEYCATVQDTVQITVATASSYGCLTP